MATVLRFLGLRGTTAYLRRQRATLATFGELALRSQNLDEILTEACRLVGDALGTHLAKVVEIQSDATTLRVRAGVGWKPGVVGVATIAAADNTSYRAALTTGLPMISPDIAKEIRFKYPQFLIDNGVRAVMNVIIIGTTGKPAYGVFQVDSRKPRRFNNDDIAFLQSYANLLAAAVDRLRALEELQVRDAELRHSQRLEAIGRLAAGVAHDFNNVLQSISSGLEIVLEDVEPGKIAHDVAKIALTSARRGASLTKQLLSYARKQLLQPEPIDVALFLDQMQRMLSWMLIQGIAINIQTDPHLPAVLADPGQLQAALLNLSVNGAHAMPGGGTLTLEGHLCADTSQRTIILSVTDTGTGMDAAMLARAAEPFFTTKGLTGSGLGLSMVGGFAEQSGGKMRIESRLGKGTRVELELPAAVSAGGGQVSRSNAEIPLQSSGTVLLVDDSEDVLFATAAFLERIGFTVSKARNGPDALKRLGSGERFDVVVTDYKMAGMTGVELINLVRVRQPNLPVVILTGYAEITELVPDGIEVVMKPFSRQTLVGALTNAIRLSLEPPTTYRDLKLVT